jgi:hypothetical protein
MFCLQRETKQPKLLHLPINMLIVLKLFSKKNYRELI